MAKTNKKMTDNQVVRRILELLKKRRRKEKDLTDYLRISSGSISKWKYDGSVLYLKYMEEICEYLDTTPNYLFFGTDDEEGKLSFSEMEILRMYRKVDNAKKNCIHDTLKCFLENEKFK